MRRRTRQLVATLLASVAALTSCETPTAVRPSFAYSPTSLSAGALYRWASGRRVMVFVDPSLTVITLGPDIVNAVDEAIRQWNRVPQFSEFSLVRTEASGSADIILFARGPVIPIEVGSCPFTPSGAAGYTYFCASGEQAQPLRLSGSNTTVSVAIQVDARLAPTQELMNALVAHEMGHAVGIGGHSPNPLDVMHIRPLGAVPTARDQQTLRYLLGQRADIRL